jgi:hypothetical protein
MIGGQVAAQGSTLVTDHINRALVVVHQDKTAHLYVNDFIEIASIKAKRAINAGESVFLSDIDDIAEVTFPDVPITSTDKVVYLTRSGFIFGLYFNLNEVIDPAAVNRDLATLKKRLFFEDHLQKSKTHAFAADATVLTEGKTDVAHLKQALAALQLTGSLRLQFDETGEAFGDTSLLAACKSYARISRAQPIICVFDRDNPKIIRELEQKTEPGMRYQAWGNNVFSLMLPVPEHRQRYQSISVEMYYSEEALHEPGADGKRLFFDNETRKEIPPGGGAIFRVIEPVADFEFTKKVIDQDADKILNAAGEPCGISKTVFASRVAAGAFKQADFAPFEAVFDVIAEILAAASK